MSFGGDVKKIAAMMGREVDQVQCAITIEIFNSVIDNTRVADPSTWKNPDPSYVGGRARGNWQTTVATPATGDLDVKDKTGTATKAKMVGAIRPRSLMIITNNLPYIGKLEEMDAMVGKTIARIGRIIRERARGGL